ncbi:hypothetical protein KKA23_02635 [Patescibacteria group bacterium]|nr:hypothetical protein [Patescibacteria group bacterium]
MKKLMVGMIFLLVVINSAMAMERFTLSVSQEKIGWISETDNAILRLFEDPYWLSTLESNKDLISHKNERMIIQANYSPCTWITVSLLTGVQKESIDFGKIDFIRKSDSINGFAWETEKDFIHTPEETNLGFLYGGKIKITFAQRENQEFFVSARYIVGNQNRLETTLYNDFAKEHDNTGKYEWYETAENQKTQTNELEIKLGMKIKRGDISISGGPMLFYAKTKFSGKSGQGNNYENYYNVRSSWKNHNEYDYEFTSKTKEKIGGFAKLAYKNFSIQIFTGARNGISVNIEI